MAAKNSVSAAVIKILILLSKIKKPVIRKMKLLEQQYSYYGYMKEYKSSPSIRRFSRSGLKKLCSNVVFIRSRFRVEESKCWSEEDSVDERAERFIRSFYEEMRRERDESGFQLLLEI